MMAAMNGMLLAAGWARRMEPLSSTIPKPALEVLGRPLLASTLANLRRAGCARIVVNLHRHPERVAAAAREAGTGEVLFSWEPELLGGAGGVAAARPLLGPGPLLVGNADTWGDLDLAPLLAAPDEATAVLALVPHPDPARWASVVLDRGGSVAAFVPAGAPGPGERFLFTGVQRFGERVLASLPEPPAEMAAVWEPLRRSGRLRGAVVTGTWREAGSPAAYRDLVVGLLGERPWVHPGAAVADGSRIERSAIGAGCRVDAGAVVSGCVLTAGAAAGPGCALRGCVLAGAVTVAGETMTDTLALPNARVPLL
jgi:NDP-sugar pyrophosphorylase family protein